VKILHTSDWHVGRRIRGRDRTDEHRSVLAELAEMAHSHEVDLTLVAGDIFDTSAPSATAEQVVWKALLDLAEISRVVVVGGNHDNPSRLDAVAPLLEKGRITMVGSPRSPDGGGVLYLSEIAVKIAMLPFVSQRGIVKAEDLMGSDPDQHAGFYEDRVRRIVASLTGEMGPDTVNLLVSHLTVFGGVAGGGERQAHVFGYAVPASVFPTHISYVALGHLHRQQKMPHASSVWYSGSPLQLDFGEVADRKGALVVDVSPGLPAQVTAAPLSSGRRLITVRGTLDQVVAQADEVADAYVKVELLEKARVGLADAVRDAIPDAVDVILESDDRPQRPPEKRRGLDPIEAFGRYLMEKGVEDPKLESLFAEILDEVSL
jgi:exonuclease SbcD